MIRRIFNDRGTFFQHIDMGEYGRGGHEVAITKKALQKEMQDMVILIQKEYDVLLRLIANQLNNAHYIAAVKAKELELQKAEKCLENIARTKA